jgi:hypothetical protein
VTVQRGTTDKESAVLSTSTEYAKLMYTRSVYIDPK